MYRLAGVEKICWIHTLVANELTAKEGGRWKGERQENAQRLLRGCWTGRTYFQDSQSGRPLTSSPHASARSGAKRGGRWGTQTTVATGTETPRTKEGPFPQIHSLLAGSSGATYSVLV